MTIKSRKGVFYDLVERESKSAERGKRRKIDEVKDSHLYLLRSIRKTDILYHKLLRSEVYNTLQCKDTYTTGKLSAGFLYRFNFTQLKTRQEGVPET